MIDWDSRLKREMPFFLDVFATHGVKSVLDAACGSGRHAVELARKGFAVTACDMSAAMLKLAKRNASAAGVEVDFNRVCLSDIGKMAPARSFDAVICLGNSLPHLLTQKELDKSIRSMRSKLAPGGVIIQQIRNYDKILKDNVRFAAPTSAEWQGKPVLFFRMLDILSARRVDFNVIRFVNEGNRWTYEAMSTRLRPVRKVHMDAAFERAGFSRVRYYSDYSFAPYDPDRLDLIAVAEK